MKKYYYLIIAVLAVVVIYLIAVRSKPAEYTELSTDRPVKGNPEASVVLVEYSDFQCPACGASQIVVKEILDKYNDKVKLEFHHFPLTSIHKFAYQAAEAAECAGDQKKFWEYHDLLYSHQNNLQAADLKNYAAEVSVNVELWEDCLSTQAKKYAIEKDLNVAKVQGLNSTPTFFLNGQKITDWRNLLEMVQALVEPLVPLQNAATTTEETL